MSKDLQVSLASPIEEYISCFEKIYSDTLIKSIYIYTGNKKNLVNYYETVKYDLVYAEKTRRFQIFKNCIKFLTPFFILKIIRKIRNKKIKF